MNGEKNHKGSFNVTTMARKKGQGWCNNKREKWQQGQDPQKLASITVFFNSKIAQAVIALTKGRKEHLQGQKCFHQQMDFKWGEKKSEQKLLGIDGGEKSLEYLRKEENEDNGVILERMVKWVPRLKVHDRGGL